MSTSTSSAAYCIADASLRAALPTRFTCRRTTPALTIAIMPSLAVRHPVHGAGEDHGYPAVRDQETVLAQGPDGSL